MLFACCDDKGCYRLWVFVFVDLNLDKMRVSIFGFINLGILVCCCHVLLGFDCVCVNDGNLGNL